MEKGIRTSWVMGLKTTDLIEAMQVLHPGERDVYIDVGDGKLCQVETIRRGEINGKEVVILRALT